MTMRLVPEEMPAEVSTAMREQQDAMEARTESVGGLGLEIGGLTAEVAQQLGETDVQGAVITRVQPGSAADQAGLRPGMIITQVNRDDVHTVEECRSALQRSNGDVLLLVRSNGASRFVALEVVTKG
jgi:serine protease Do